MRPLRFLATFLLALTLTLGVLGATVFTVNPRGEFSLNFLPPITAGDPDEKQNAYNRLPSAPDVVVIGNSIAMTLSSEMMERVQGAGFNFAFPGASLADMTAVVARMEADSKVPENLWVSLDVFSLFAAPRTPRLANHTNDGLEDIAALWGALMSRSYVQDTFTSIEFAIFGYPQGRFRFDSAGNLPEGFRFSGHIRPEDGIPRVREFSRLPRVLEPADLPGLQLLLSELNTSGANVTLFIPPMHPFLIDSEAHSAWSQGLDELRLTAIIACTAGMRFLDLSKIPAAASPALFEDFEHYFPEVASNVATELGSNRNDC
ncbi:MAG: hypothetical protein AABX89_01435 [Candidatus Thermoplasmatota archaeon]